MNKQAVLVINLYNNQSSYARCLDVIESILEFQMCQDENEHYQVVKEKMSTYSSTATDFKKRIHFSLNEQLINSSKKYYEEPLFDNNSVKLNVLASIPNKSKKDKFIEYAKNNRMNFHLRVHFSKNDGIYSEFSELHYLAMLISNYKKNIFLLNNQNKDSKLTVFLVPTSGELYPYQNEFGYVDTELYNKASHYLRLITKAENGIIFGFSEEADCKTVQALDFKSFCRNPTEFPLLFLEQYRGNSTIDYFDKSKNNRVYIRKNKNIDNYNLLFNRANMPDRETIRKSFAYNTDSAIPFNYATDQNPNIALADFILDSAREKILLEFARKDSVKSNLTTRKSLMNIGRGYIGKYIDNIAEIAQKNDRITFAIFSFLLDIKDCNSTLIERTIKSTYDLAQEISLGLKQLVQNSLQYSDSHACFITFCKTSKNELKIIVTDSNRTSTIAENFIERLIDEKQKISESTYSFSEMIDGYQVLIDYASNNKVKVKNLLSFFDNNDEKNMWYFFRQSDISAHIGLTLFSQTARLCEAKLRVVSNRTLHLHKENVFSYNYFNDTTIEDFSDNYIIAGTQIELVIPIKSIFFDSIENGAVQLSTGQHTQEDYNAYAEYLDFKAIPILEKKGDDEFSEFIHKTRNYNTSISEEKFNLQRVWTIRFIEMLEKAKEKQLNVFSATDFPSLYNLAQSDDYCEVLVKSLFSAVARQNTEKKLFFAFINFPVCFIRVFRSLSSSNLALMRFPPNIQLYFSDTFNNDEKKLIPQQKHQIVFLGSSIGMAVQNSYIFSLEQGVPSFSSHEYIASINTLNIFDTQVAADIKANSISNYLVMPFSSLINNNCIPEYFERIKELTELPMCDDNSGDKIRGFKFSHTHMRLGNKVHTEEFYEMSFLFYRTIVANRVAFHILRHLLNMGIIDQALISNNSIVFYGYASYSQAIIMSLAEILKKYIDTFKKDISYSGDILYASYQYNLQTSSSVANIHVHRNDIKRINNSLVIQIVPISSTLTTFDKMWAEYLLNFKEETPKLIANYTVYLVRHQQRNTVGIDLPLNSNSTSDIEKKYWNTIDTETRTVFLNKSKFDHMSKCDQVYFIMNGGAHWHLPLTCPYCYPQSVFFEMPLVETDPTSTVPAQQIHFSKNIEDFNEKNIERIKSLYECVYYGHFSRSKNHFQFYINTQKYFARTQNEIKEWLENESLELNTKKNNPKPILNIIFSPEHNTNVGFSQYVNAYYFKGTAEIVSVNEDKQFRSNFICENDAIRQTIKRLFEDFPNIEKPVRFFFVDDNIVTGDTFRKASNLLQSLIPNEYHSIYGTNVFEKCFFLIDRLSYSTKESYVIEPNTNFISFCKINISNMRTYGDSCVGCKLESEANHLFRRSSTKITANYWARKSQDYKVVPFDSDELKKHSYRDSYVRLVLSHLIQKNIIFMKNIESGCFFDWCLSMIRYFLDLGGDINGEINRFNNETQSFIKDIEQRSKDEDGKCFNSSYPSISIYLIATFIKLLARPFYTYDYNIKTQIVRLAIIMCEILLGCDNEIAVPVSSIPEHKDAMSFYTQGTRWNDTIKVSLMIKEELLKSNEYKFILLFIQDCLFESLSDLRSTYLLRKSTLIKVWAFLKKIIKSPIKQCEKCNASIPNRDCRKRPISTTCQGDLVSCFLRQYAIHLHRIIDTSSDETRALWMEQLILTGHENNEVAENDNIGKDALFKSIVQNDENEDILFKYFCNQIFLQNTRLLFDGLERIYNSRKEKKQGNENYPIENRTNSDNFDMANPYFMDNYIESRKYLNKYIKSELPGIESEELNMFALLHINDTSPSKTKDSIVDKRYYLLLHSIKKMISEKYNSLNFFEINVALLTQKHELNNKEYILDIIRTDFENQFDEATPINDSQIQKWSKLKSIIKDRVDVAINQECGSNLSEGDLNEQGYYMIFPSKCTSKEYMDAQKKNFYSNKDSYHKPYFILKFNNDKYEFNLKLGRKIRSIEDIYIYIDFIISDESDRNVLPWLIMRDILTYRNRLLEYFEEDFNSDIIQRSYHSSQEKTILEHEKAASHSSTVDDSVCIEMFKNADNDVPTNEQLLLLRNYNNTTISKLFNRSFHDDCDGYKYSIKKPSLDVPKLYLAEDEGESDLKRRLVFFSDLNIFNNMDRRFKWLMTLLDIKKVNIDNPLVFACHNNTKSDRFFNLEYMKCIIMDILLSAAKSKTLAKDFLKDVKMLSDIKKYNDPSAAPMPRISRIVYFTKEETSCNEGFDYLSIINSVQPTVNISKNTIKIKNQEIQYHLNDPIDYPGGHMSLLTIKRYIENLNPEVLSGKTCFHFIELEELKSKYNFITENDKIWFESKLPIFKKENNIICVTKS